MESRVDLVTLSDSLTSPLPKPKPKARAAVKGTPKVVCLDSDTESDGSYTQTNINKLTSNAANSGIASNASEKANNRRLGLRKCSNDRKPSSSIPLSLENKCSNDQNAWTPALSLSFKKEIEGDLIENKAMDQPKSCCDAGILEADFDADAKCKQDAEIKLLSHSNDLCSPQNVSSFGFKDKLHIDHKPLLQSKSIADVGLHSSYSPSESLEQGICIGSFGSHSTSMLSASPCHEVQNAFYMESKPSSDAKGMDALKTYGLCSSLLSNESDGYPSMPTWNDHLKGIISKLETSKSTDVRVGISQEQPFEHRINAESSDDDMDSGGYSSWKRKFYELGRHNVGDTELSDSGDSISCKRQKKSGKGQSGRAGSGVDARTTARTAGAGGCSFWKRKIYEPGGHNVGDGESSDSGDSLSCKRQKKSGKGGSGSAASGVDVRTTARTAGDSTKALEKEAEKQEKVEKRMKDKEEKEAKMKHLKEERENLRREKQEEKKRQQEVRKMRNKEEKKRKEELKAEAVERRKVEKEKGKWEKGKFALQNITAFVDTQILEGGLIGGHLLTRFAEKGFNYRLVKNPVKKTVIWQMKLPSKESIPNPQADSKSQDSQELNAPNQSGPELLLESIAISYVLVVLEAEEFLDMITRDDLDNHIRSLQEQYPGFTLCYLINKLMRYLNKREQQQYKNPANNWIRPPVEQVLAKLVTSYNGVHSRLCLDEAEVSDHIVGLTRSLAECPFKPKLTLLSLSANGDHVKNDPNSDIIKKHVWLKALVALPKISGSCAIAIAKKYPSMSAIFEAYLDPSKTVHEKEYLLQDLMKEGLLGGETNRRVGPACSRRVYRILMAQQGNLHTDDVEEGADLFID